jgi:TetR/AcrR family transcriptional repressor of nem operon
MWSDSRFEGRGTGMGRRPGYELQAVLRASAALFRTRGFHEVSVPDILAATGLNRFALYEKFGGKEGLFYATLDYYHGVMVKRGLLDPLYRETASAGTLIKRLRMLQRMNLNPELRPGCLIVNANIELGRKDERVAEAARFVGATFREAVGHALARAAHRGELSASKTVEERADYVALMIQAFFSLAFLSRETADRLMTALIEEVRGWKVATRPPGYAMAGPPLRRLDSRTRVLVSGGGGT